MRKPSPDLAELQAVLEATILEERWRPILQTCAVSGVADMLQLSQTTGLTRDTLRRTLEKLEVLPEHFPPVVTRLERKIKRPGLAGRAPAIYTLGPGGAALLRTMGFVDARPCELKDSLSILHALAMLSIHLAAKKAGATLTTDQTLPYGNGQVLRPDHRLTLADGRQVLIEIEQAARPKLIPRILESLTHKQAFFTSPQGQSCLPEVRLIFNLPPGRELRQTLKVWREAVSQVVQKGEKPLAFHLVAIPLVTFLATPEWGESLSDRWVPILEAEAGGAMEAEAGLSVFQRPRSTLEDDITLLWALQQKFTESPARQALQPDPDLFYLVEVIYAASFGGKGVQPEAGAAAASVYLLKAYLDLHSDLRTRLRRALHYNSHRMVWSQANILHRMNIVIRTFLSYYGWRTNGRLVVHAMADWEGSGQFGVVVRTNNMVLLGRGRDDQVINGLSWVLWALFEYAEDLELGRPEFW